MAKKKNDLSARMQAKRAAQGNKTIPREYEDLEPPVRERTVKKKRRVINPMESLGVDDYRRQKKIEKMVEENYDAGWHQSGEKRKRSRITENPLFEDVDLDSFEDPIMDQAKEEVVEIEKAKKLHRRNVIKSRILSGCFTILCAYLVFLIYGCINTDYVYNDKGVVEPQIMSVEDLREKKDFDKIYADYEMVASLYKKVLILDYQLAEIQKAGGSVSSIATEYESIVQEIIDTSYQVKGLAVNEKYMQLKKMMFCLIYNDDGTDQFKDYGFMYEYCRNVAEYLTQGGTEANNNAIIARDNLYSYYCNIANNLYSIGKEINGANITSLVNFDPLTYGEDYALGKVK